MILALRNLNYFLLLVTSPKLTVIVVQKRNNARFFMKSGNELTNPFVGTVVDDHVVKEHGYRTRMQP